MRGTTRDPARVNTIEAAGIEAAVADPDRIATILEQLEGVTLIYWLLGAASGAPGRVAALHTDRLERLLEEIVDTPVRGFVYELANWLDGDDALRALELLRSAGQRWRIPFEVVDAPPDDHESWLAGMRAAAAELVA